MDEETAAEIKGIRELLDLQWKAIQNLMTVYTAGTSFNKSQLEINNHHMRRIVALESEVKTLREQLIFDTTKEQPGG